MPADERIDTRCVHAGELHVYRSGRRLARFLTGAQPAVAG